MTAARHPKRAHAQRAAHARLSHSHPRTSFHSFIHGNTRREARDCACCGVSDTIITEDTSRIGFAPPKETGSYAGLAREERRQVCERLISAFQNKPKSDWRRLITFSKKWPQLADGVFERIQELVDDADDPEVKLKLRRFQKGMRAAHEEIVVYRELYSQFETTEDSEHAALVAGHYDEMTPNFFEYCKDRMNAAMADKDIPEDKREAKRMEITSLIAGIMALYEAYEAATKDQGRNNLAAENFKHLLKVGSMAEAQAEIDKMAAQGTLDPAFLTTMARAYSGVKESPYTKDDTKEIMHKLYMQARETSNRQQPAEVRILKHLLTIEDPKHRRTEMESAFEIGPELETANEDYLWTTPEKLLMTIDTVLSCFQNFKGDTSALGSAMSVLMKPKTIEKMEVIKLEIEKDFM